MPLPAQRRIADTRNPQVYPFVRLTDRRIRVGIVGVPGVPANATAAVLTVTVVNRVGVNFVSAYPAGSAVPEASNLNTAVHDEVAANLVTVQLGAGGAVDLDAFDLCDIVVDLAGVYVPAPTGLANGGRFVALPSAARVIDTRSTAVLLPGQSVVVDVTSVVPADASSVVINLTTTGTLAWGFFTCYPLDAAGPSETSNLNVNGPGQTRAAAAVVKVTTVGGVRGFKVWSYGGGHVIVDVAGYYTGTPAPTSSRWAVRPDAAAADPRHPQARRDRPAVAGMDGRDGDPRSGPHRRPGDRRQRHRGRRAWPPGGSRCSPPAPRCRWCRTSTSSPSTTSCRTT